MPSHYLIKLSKTIEYTIILDDQGLLLFKKHTWHIKVHRNTQYLYRKECKNYKQKTISFHRELLGLKTGTQVVDHINNNGLDNRVCNLRLCTNKENIRNQKKSRGFSKFKGVTYRKAIKKWFAYIVVDRKQIPLGYYVSEEEAAEAYNVAAVKYFRNYANLNEVIYAVS